MTDVLALYGHCLESMPVLTKSISAALLIGFGDFVSQKLEHKKSFDWARLFRVMTFAAFIGAPALHFWYSFLDTSFPEYTASHVLVKTTLDQCVFTPLSILVFFAVLGLGEGLSLEEISKDLKVNFLPTLRTSFIVWPLASFINFCFVHAKFRIIFVGAVSLLWNSYLSFVKHTQDHILPVTNKASKPTPSGKVAIT